MYINKDGKLVIVVGLCECPFNEDIMERLDKIIELLEVQNARLCEIERDK